MDDRETVIVAVEVKLVDLPAEVAYQWRKGLPGSDGETVGGLLCIRTANGCEGCAITRRGLVLADLVGRHLRDAIVGESATRRELLWNRVWEIDRREPIPSYLMGLVDVALWDWFCKSARLPLHQLIGGFRSEIDAYASLVVYPTTDEIIEVAVQAVELGYNAVKVHGTGQSARDIDLCQRLRETLGDDIKLMYDGAGAFSLSEAVVLGRALGEADFFWYEEPMRETNITSYRWLSERIEVPLLVAETVKGAHWAAADFLVTGCASFIRTGATFKGGITGALRIAHLAESFGVGAEVHQSGVVSQNLCMAIPNTSFYESRVVGNPIERESLVGRDGRVRAPREVGFGFENLIV
jgi:L-alanine-DL-glutamate epimerase-like enolase superfamily enzyme